MIEDKSDAHSGSESSGSDELSHQSASNVTTSTSIISAFNAHHGRRSHVTSSSTDVNPSEGFGEAARGHHIAHYTSSQPHHASGFFPTNGGGHLGLQMMPGFGGHESSPHVGGHPHQPTEANRKRAVRLQKNREAARECRRKKKEYIKCLENRVAVLENQNKALIEELKSLKELYAGKSYGASEF